MGTMARILIIDDDAHTCQMVGEFLRRQGNEVTSATDGGTGLAMAAAAATDLILCDLDMPGLDGQGVVSALRQDEKLSEIPVIFLSGCTDHEQIRRTMNLGADDFLTKPARLAEILAAVNARLALHRKKRNGKPPGLSRPSAIFPASFTTCKIRPGIIPPAACPGSRWSPGPVRFWNRYGSGFIPPKAPPPCRRPSRFWPRTPTGNSLSNCPRCGCFRPTANIRRPFGVAVSRC